MYILYNRLINVLIERKPDSTEFHIADMLIRNMKSLSEMSIKETADLCAVSKSTMSKFVRDLGFDDYWDFRLEVRRAKEKELYNVGERCNITDYIRDNGIEKYEKVLARDIYKVLYERDEEQLKRLVKDIHDFPNIAAFGVSYSEMAAMNFQHKMHYYQRFVYTTLNDGQQEAYIKDAQEDTLLIIFSNSGKYITEFQNQEGSPKKSSFDVTKAKVVLITSNEKMTADPRVDECVLLHYSDRVQNHPILYQLLIEKIANTYEQIYGTPDLLLMQYYDN